MAQRSYGNEEESGQSVLDVFADWYHVPVLLAFFVAMLWIRLQSYDRYVRGDDVLFSGNDAWYHLRQVEYTVRNWPGTMPFDPWTYFPYGTSVGQFGTLYDQLIATAALVVGLGSPSDQLVAEALLVAPAVFGALTVVPTYLIGKRLAGRVAGLFGALLIALLPGVFLSRTLVGVADHNAAEPFFQGMAVFCLLVAFTVAEREKPIWELVLDRDLDALRQPLLWAGLAGVATGLYMWVWPPGILLVGIVGVFLALKLSSDVVSGTSPEPVAFVGAVSMGVTAVVMLVPLSSLGFSPTQFSLIQPLFALGVAVGCVFLAWLAREWEARDIDPWLYPTSVLAIVVVGVVLVSVVSQPLFNIIVNNLQRTVGFDAGAQTRTIGEAQPYLSPSLLQSQGYTATNRILSDYGFTFFTALVAAVWLLVKPLVKSGDSRRLGFLAGGFVVTAVIFLIPAVPDGIGSLLGLDSVVVSLGIVTALIVGAALLATHRAAHLFVVLWAAFIAAAAFTQVRFNYYLAVPVAVMNAVLLREVLDYLGVRGVPTHLSDIKGYQVVTVVAVVMLITAPVLLVPIDVRNTGTPQFDRSSTAWESATQNGPGDITRWDGTLRWMANETPEEGALGGANGELDYYGTYRDQADFAYPDGSYGVQSWWDYGHWITVRGERIPNANPFQQGATSAANFLLAPDEAAAEEVLASQSEEGENTRYVMVDWQMATPGSKFGAPIVFYDDGNVSRSDFYDRVYSSNLRQSFNLRHQRYYDSMMVRLYEYHGSAVEPQPIVLDWQRVRAQTQSGQTITVNAVPENESPVREFDTMAEARAYVENDSTSQIGGLGRFPEERVPALQHYRLVKVSEASAVSSGSYGQEYQGMIRVTGAPYGALVATEHNWVKAFERVPGATVSGSGAPANSNVTAAVELRVPTTNATFTYTQRAETDENGEFTMTLPYATTGYDEYGPENGYTNVSVRATGPYRLSTDYTVANDTLTAYSANRSVPEGAVNGAESGELSVELEERSTAIDTGSNESDAGGDGSMEGGSTATETGESGSADDGTDSENASVDGNAPTADDAPAAVKAPLRGVAEWPTLIAAPLSLGDSAPVRAVSSPVTADG